MAVNPEITREIRVIRKALDMIEADLAREDPPHVDDRDEAYHLAGVIAGKAKQLEDLIGNTLANDAFTVSQLEEMKGNRS